MTQKLMELSPESFSIIYDNFLAIRESEFLDSKVSCDIKSRIIYEFVLGDCLIYISYNYIEISFIKEDEVLIIRRKR